MNLVNDSHVLPCQSLPCVHICLGCSICERLGPQPGEDGRVPSLLLAAQEIKVQKNCHHILKKAPKPLPRGSGAGMCTGSVSLTILRFTWAKLDATGSAWMLPSSPILQAKGELPGELNARLRKAATYFASVRRLCAGSPMRCTMWRLETWLPVVS